MLTAIFFAMIMDSGGELGLRLPALAALALLTVLSVRRFSVSASETAAWLALAALLAPSVLIAVFGGVPARTIAIWTAPILAFPLVLGTVRANRITTKPFIDGGLIFAVVVIVLFFGRLNQIEPIVAVHDYLAERSAGFFNEKTVYFDEPIPVVYFQGVLTLVVCAVLAIGHKRYLAYATFCTALVVAPSRFGIFLAVVFGMLVMLRRFHRRTAFRILVVPVLALAVAGFLSLPDSFVEIFSSGGEGATTRLLHVSSVLDVLSDSPQVLLFGQGPGSVFFSKAVGELTDNIEISQLEALRKFGLPFVLSLTLLLVAVCVRLARQGEEGIALALAAHFIVALSNPVLFSLPATFLLAIAVATLHSPRWHAPYRRRRRHLQPVGQRA